MAGRPPRQPPSGRPQVPVPPPGPTKERGSSLRGPSWLLHPPVPHPAPDHRSPPAKSLGGGCRRLPSRPPKGSPPRSPPNGAPGRVPRRGASPKAHPGRVERAWSGGRRPGVGASLSTSRVRTLTEFQKTGVAGTEGGRIGGP